MRLNHNELHYVAPLPHNLVCVKIDFISLCWICAVEWSNGTIGLFCDDPGAEHKFWTFFFVEKVYLCNIPREVYTWKRMTNVGFKKRKFVLSSCLRMLFLDLKNSFQEPFIIEKCRNGRESQGRLWEGYARTYSNLCLAHVPFDTTNLTVTNKVSFNADWIVRRRPWNYHSESLKINTTNEMRK